MAKDRLADLRPIGGWAESVAEIFIQTTIDDCHHIDDLFYQVEWIHQIISHIEECVKKVKAKHGEILADPNNDNRLKEELSELMDEIKRASNKTKVALQLIKQELEEGIGDTSANYRIRQTQCNILSKKFVNVINEYNACQVTYRQKCKERIQRQLAIAGKDTTDEELEDMIEAGNPQIFNQGIVMETQAAKRRLAEIEARHEDIMKLENSIRELYDMFMDMAMLVESQGQMIDRIEYNVQQAGYVVEDAAKIIKKAVVMQKRRCVIS